MYNQSYAYLMAFLPMIFVISIFELTKTARSAFKVLGVGSIGLLVKMPSFSGTHAIPIPTGDTSPIIVIVLALYVFKTKTLFR